MLHILVTTTTTWNGKTHLLWQAKYIKGANVSGIESVFITGGIHGSELDLSI